MNTVEINEQVPAKQCSMKDKTLSLGTAHFQETNERIRHELNHCDELDLIEVCAQRYLGCALPMGKSLRIHGVPGNDLAAYMDGGTVEVFGNAQDQIGNTMNGGEIIVHGRCGDAAGYAMRGGSIFIRDDCGWRVGINMKQYDSKKPVIVIGGNAGSFLGEYMAGGIIVLLGTAGAHLATGMHGGVIYLQKKPDETMLSDELQLDTVTQQDVEVLERLLTQYEEYFSSDADTLKLADPQTFYKLMPASSRPYASMYAQ